MIATPVKHKDRSHTTAPDKSVPSDDDTDLEYDEDVLLRRIHKDRSDCRQMYEAACKHYDVVVSSQFITHMKGKRVQLTDLALGPSDIKTMCIPLLYNTTVSVLDFSGNNLGNKGVIHVMDMLKENVHIDELHLARNNISRSGARNICSSLLVNHKIRKLNLSGNLLGDVEASYFADLLRSNSIIKILDLSNNRLGEKSGAILGAVLAENGALEELDLSWNHIRLQGAVALARSLRDNDTLKRLDVSWNGFTNEGAAEMGQALCENFTLKELNMNCNRIHLAGLGHLAKGINANEGLTTLKLGDNPILAIGAEMILQVIQKSETTKVNRLNFEHVPVSYNFAATLEELNQERGGLNVKHDCKIRYADHFMRQEGCTLMGDPVRVLMMYSREHRLNMTDALVSCPECCAELCVDDIPFRTAIRRMNPPLNEIQIEALAKRLYKYDANDEFLGVDISSLVDAEEYRQKRTAHLAQIDQQSLTSSKDVNIDDNLSEMEQPQPDFSSCSSSRIDNATPLEDRNMVPEIGDSDHGAPKLDFVRQVTEERPPLTAEDKIAEPVEPASVEDETTASQGLEE